MRQDLGLVTSRRSLRELAAGMGGGEPPGFVGAKNPVRSRPSMRKAWEE